MEKPIIILGCSKSGTTLLRNLFDGHPDLFVIPTESHFFENIHYWINYPYRSTRPQNLSFEEMKVSLYKWINYVNSVYQQTTDAFTKGRWNVEKVKQVLDSRPVHTLRELSDLYINAIHSGLHGSMLQSGKSFVEKSVENAELACEWKTLYPQARFIHIIRNPYANIVALRNYANKSKFPFLKNAIYAMHNSYYHLYKNIFLFNDYKVIRYEDLLTSPELVLNDLCNYLDIEFNKSLLSPTLLGEPWQGNSSSGKKFTNISTKNINTWQDQITSFEINVINILFSHILEDYNYTRQTSKKSIYYPTKNERVKEFILNRLLIKYLPQFKK